MKQILKRLELIKTSIDIDEEEIIELQIAKLKKLPIDEDIQNILVKLENLEYALALSEIDSYLKKYSALTEFVDAELEALKLELKSFESRLQKLSEEKQDILHDIEEFNTLYNIKLGDIIGAILELKQHISQDKIDKKRKKLQENEKQFEETKETVEEIEETLEELENLLEEIDEDNENYEELKNTYDELQEEIERLQDELKEQEDELQKSKEELEDDPLYEEYEEAKTDYEQFQDSYEELREKHKEIFKLDPQKKKELKTLWKKASRLCHPDLVTDELKEQANKIMQQLNEAYSKKDIEAVKKIYLSLENGAIFTVASESIDDKDVLKAKIADFKATMAKLEQEIEEIKEDETYQTIQEIDDWDEYFENLRKELEMELYQLEDGLAEETETWTNKLNRWADTYNIPVSKLPRDRKKLLALKVIDFTNIHIKNLPEEIGNLENITEIILWGCDMKFLPFSIVNFTNLKKLNLRGNPHLKITIDQEKWIKELQETATVYIEAYKVISSEELASWMQQEEKIIKQSKKVDILEDFSIMIENSDYAKTLQNITNISFEKIRRSCANLVKENQANYMTKELSEYAKQYKALIYDALEQFMYELTCKELCIVDWGCSQGLGVALTLDYIKEKQLDIKVTQIILIDDDTKALSRAMLHCDVLKQNDLDIVAIDINKDMDKINKIKKGFALNLFVNDYDNIQFTEVDFNKFVGDYFVCISPNNKSIVDTIYQQFPLEAKTKILTERKTKIGRFGKYEKIFQLTKMVTIPVIEIDEDELPF